jgi:hypothetical protein
MAERSNLVDFISLKLSGCFVASRLAMMPLRAYRGAIKNRAGKTGIPVFCRLLWMEIRLCLSDAQKRPKKRGIII